MKWYYAQNNQRHGPISESEFDFLVHQKKILPDNLVWNETMADWKPLHAVQPEPVAPPEVYSWAPPLPAAPVERDGPAWEERDSIGGLNAAAKTVREMLGNTSGAFTRMKRMSDWAGPFGYALFLGLLGYYAKLFYDLIYLRFETQDLGQMGNIALIVSTNYGALFFIIFSYFTILAMIPVIIILNSVLIHFSLVLLGAAKHPFQTTYRVTCYSFGTSSVFQFVPIMGLFLAPALNLVLMINGIAKLHEISTGKAAIALLPVAFYTSFFFLRGMGQI